MVRATCPMCGKALRGGDDWAGKVGQCPHCQSDVQFPAQPGAFQQQSPGLPQSIIVPRLTSSTTTQNWAAQLETSGRDLLGFERDINKPRFPALRMIARGYEVLAVFVVLGAILFILYSTVAVLATNTRAWAGLLIIIPATILFTSVITVTLLFAAQLIRLGLQIEQNTRDTCRALAERSKPADPPASVANQG